MPCGTSFACIGAGDHKNRIVDVSGGPSTESSFFAIQLRTGAQLTKAAIT